MAIRVLINGAKGKMGQEAVAAVTADPDLLLVGETTRHDDLAKAINESKAQVVVDLTVADAVLKNATTIIQCGAHPVIGTSGLLPEEVMTLQQQCREKQLGGIIVPNFCIGVVLMMKYAKDAARYLPHAEIIEMHHDQKVDAPSGTAIKTAQMMQEERRQAAPASATTRETLPGSRGAQCQDIHIHAVRLPGLVAHQTVIFGGESESLTIRHDSLHRRSFMPGLLLSCKKVPQLNELLYGLEHIM